MPIEVETPDGGVAEFPDGTPHEVIKSALRKKFGGGTPAEPDGPPTPHTASQVARGVGQMVKEVGTGALKSAGQLPLGVARLQQKIMGGGLPEGLEDSLKPSGAGEEIGASAERAAEVMSPNPFGKLAAVKGLANAPWLLRALARGTADAARAGGAAALHGDENPGEQALAAGLVGGAGAPTEAGSIMGAFKGIRNASPAAAGLTGALAERALEGLATHGLGAAAIPAIIAASIPGSAVTGAARATGPALTASLLEMLRAKKKNTLPAGPALEP